MTNQAFIRTSSLKARDLALVAILLAIGSVLYAFTPNIGSVTPDSVVTFAVLAILLVNPRLVTGFGIGVVSGFLSMMFSKSPLPWLNIPVHAIGAFAATLVEHCFQSSSFQGKVWMASLAGITYSLVSGGLFVTGLQITGLLPPQVSYWAAWVQVLLSTISTVLIITLVYPHAHKRFKNHSI